MKTIFFTLLLSTSSFLYCQTLTNYELLVKYIDYINNIQNLEFKSTIKGTDINNSADTFITKSRCLLKTKSDDTIGYLFYFESKSDSITFVNNKRFLYDGNSYKIIDDSAQAVSFYDLKKMEYDDSRFTVYEELGLRPLIALKYLKNNSENIDSVEVNKNIFQDSRNCIKFTVYLKDHFPINNTRTDFYIDSNTHFLVSYKFWSSLYSNPQYIEYKYDSVKIDQPGFENLWMSKFIISKGYKWYDGLTICSLKSFKVKTDSLIGNSAPEWELNDLFGKKYTLSELKGKVILMDFWFRGCGLCLKSMPVLESIYGKYKNNGLIVLGLNPFDTNKKTLLSFIEKKQITYSVIINTGKIETQYPVAVYPTLFIIDRTGKIFKIIEGYDEKFEKELETVITDLLNK